MLRTRKDLYELTRKYYITLLERVAKRYRSDEPYVVVDHVGYECTRLEDLFRPLWGIAPLISDDELCITVDGKSTKVRDFITEIIVDGTSPDSDRRFDRDVTEVSLINFANQCITELAAYLIAVHFCKDTLWTPLTKETKDSIATWIHKYAMIALKDSWPNNHYWYPVFSIEILKELGYYDSNADEYMKKAYGEVAAP